MKEETNQNPLAGRKSVGKSGDMSQDKGVMWDGGSRGDNHPARLIITIAGNRGCDATVPSAERKRNSEY